MIYLLIAIG